MENGADKPDSTTSGNFSGSAMDLDFMDELLYEGCWLETSDSFSFSQPTPSTSAAPQYFPFVDSISTQNQHIQQKSESENQTNESLVKSEGFPIGGSELSRSLWIEPRAYERPASTVKKRLMQAVAQLKGYTENREILVQIWVPTKKEGKNVLTTIGQPCLLSLKSESLASYRFVSETYHFPVDGDSKDSLGLPGRVFLGMLPESTPDVRFFRSDEYPRKSYAKQYNIGGSLAVPIFERGTGSCLGVVEVVTTSQNISYRPELETICKALEAVDLKSSQDYCPPSVKACKEFCQAVVPEISEILASVCTTHNLPLALTWARCFQQGKGGCRHFDEKFAHCISTLDSACMVADRELLAFHAACSEQYLYAGQGIVGKAFMANKQCFASDIAAFSKTDYPLSHHAKVLNLHAAVAIPLRSSSTGSADFVLELFLPKDCLDAKEQRRMRDLLPLSIQQTCRSLHVVMEVLEEDSWCTPVASDGTHNILENYKVRSSSLKEASLEGSSWISQMMVAQQKGKQVYVSWDQPKEPKEEFKVASHLDGSLEELYLKHGYTESGEVQHDFKLRDNVEGISNSSFTGQNSSGGRKTGEKRRTKTEKSISLEVLRQYFAGSLKDAAKSIGVCPTTLKRICRQHGITRWPSRKLKKVGHSLKKLQLVIDSVQGAEGAIQIDSFYKTFPDLSSPNICGNGSFGFLKMNDDSKPLNPHPENGPVNAGATASKSPSSSCSQSSGSSTCCSTETKKHSIMDNASNPVDALKAEYPVGELKRARSDAELHAVYCEEPKPLVRSQSHKILGDNPILETLPTLPKSGGRCMPESGTFRVKANYGEEKVRFSLQPNWDFNVLQGELAKRFSIKDVSRIDLKYLDDDCEWVLLTCDADLEECKDIYRIHQGQTIRMSVHQSWQPLR
ncbi:protein NLP2-like [Euphorbia lathyris]|uniref:protein NLP2-like n=1 Tax=Euphorbia lathyris TaxID=212925 RepID=UPI003313A701